MRWPWGLGVACLLTLACQSLGGDRENNYREDVLLCEEAVATILDCCPDFRPPEDSCEYYERVGCNEDSQFPVISRQQSECLRDLACAQIGKAGGCAALQVKFDRLLADDASASQASTQAEATLEAMCR